MTKQAIDIKKRLSLYRGTSHDIDMLYCEIERLKALGENKQECCNVSHMRNKTILSLGREREAKKKELKLLDQLLSELDAVERDVLTCRYILGLSWNKCFSEMRKKKHYYSQRTIFRIHNSAIMHMAQANNRKKHIKNISNL